MVDLYVSLNFVDTNKSVWNYCNMFEHIQSSMKNKYNLYNITLDNATYIAGQIVESLH